MKIFLNCFDASYLGVGVFGGVTGGIFGGGTGGIFSVLVDPFLAGSLGFIWL